MILVNTKKEVKESGWGNFKKVDVAPDTRSTIWGEFGHCNNYLHIDIALRKISIRTNP